MVKSILKLALLSVMLTPVSVFAQFKKISVVDAQSMIDKAADEYAKVDSIKKWGHKVFMSANTDGSISILQDGISLAKSINYKESLLPLYMQLGRSYEQLKKHDEALSAFVQAKQYVNLSTPKLDGDLYFNIGRTYQSTHQYDSMMHYYTLTEQWNEANQPYRNWILYESWHNIHVEQSNYIKAEEYLLKAYEITKPEAKRMDHGLVLYRLRSLLSRTGNMIGFAQYTKEYYDLVSKSGGNTNMVHGFEFDKSLSSAEKIRRLTILMSEYKSMNLPQQYYTTVEKLASLHFNEKSYLKSLDLYKMIQDPIEVTNYKSFETVYQNMHVIYQTLGDYNNAYKYALKLDVVKDSLSRAEKNNILLDLEKKYETDKKEQGLAIMTAENELKDIKIKSNQTQRLLLGTIIAVLTSLLGALWYLFSKNKKFNKELTYKNEIIQKNLDEKEILLREIHHRVKNNLQVVSSLLSLQSNYIQDDAALKAINEGKDRVSSMALIHQNLYKDGDIMSIETRHYFDELIDHLFDSYNIREDDILLQKQIESIQIDVDTMIPLGLIANELISNALKHGFKMQEKGLLTFTLKQIDNQLYMSVKDDGIGMDKDSFLSSKSFGNKMIAAFLQKLGAELIISNDKGTNIELYISKYKVAAA